MSEEEKILYNTIFTQQVSWPDGSQSRKGSLSVPWERKINITDKIANKPHKATRYGI